MKKLIPVLASVAVVGVVALAFLQQKKSSQTADSEVSSDESGNKAPDVAPSTESPSGTAAVAAPSLAAVVPVEPTKVELVDSLLTKLAAQSLLSIDFVPRNIDQMATPVFGFYEKLNKTKAWKRLNPNAMISAGAEKAAEGNPAMAMFGGFAQSGEVPPPVKEIWEGLSEFSLAFSTKTVPVDANGKHFDVPPLAIIAKFSSEATAKKYIDLISQQIEPLKAQAEMMGIKLTQPNPTTLEVEAPVPGVESPVTASLSMKAPHIVLLLGTNDLLNFFEKKSATPSEAAMIASRSWIPSAAIAGSFQLNTFWNLIQQLMISTMPPGQMQAKELEQMKSLFAMYDGAKLATFSVGSFTSALRNNSCLQLAPGSNMEKMYSAVTGKSGPGKLSTAALLVDDQTLIAFDYPIALVQQTWEMFKDKGREMGKDLPPEQRSGLEAFEKVNGMLSRFSFQKMVVSVAAAPSGSMPRAALLLTDSKLSGEELLKQFADAINEMVAFAQTSQGGTAPTTPLAKIGKNGSTSQIQIQAGMMQVVGQLAGDNSLAFGIDPYYLANISSKLVSSKSPEFLISKFGAAKADLLSAAQVTYLNTGLSLDILKPWMSAAIPPGKDITAEELTEITDLLRTTFVSTQRVDQIQSGLICSFAATYQN